MAHDDGPVLRTLSRRCSVHPASWPVFWAQDQPVPFFLPLRGGSPSSGPDSARRADLSLPGWQVSHRSRKVTEPATLLTAKPLSAGWVWPLWLRAQPCPLHLCGHRQVNRPTSLPAAARSLFGRDSLRHCGLHSPGSLICSQNALQEAEGLEPETGWIFPSAQTWTRLGCCNSQVRLGH